MAVEVEISGYLFQEGKNVQWAPRDAFLEKHGSPDFLLNPLHDLESLWWVSVDALNAIRFLAAEDDAMDYLGFQKKLPWTFYNNRDRRAACIMDDGKFLEEVKGLHPQLQPGVLALELLRMKLVAAYRKIELEAEPTPYTVTHSRICRKFPKWLRMPGASRGIGKRSAGYRPCICHAIDQRAGCLLMHPGQNQLIRTPYGGRPYKLVFSAMPPAASGRKKESSDITLPAARQARQAAPWA